MAKPKKSIETIVSSGEIEVNEVTETLPEIIEEIKEPEVLKDIIVDNNVFQVFNRTTFINFNNVAVIHLIEYSQPSSNIYKFYYEFHLNTGRFIESPKFPTRQGLDNWLDGIKNNG